MIGIPSLISSDLTSKPIWRTHLKWATIFSLHRLDCVKIVWTGWIWKNLHQKTEVQYVVASTVSDTDVNSRCANLGQCYWDSRVHRTCCRLLTCADWFILNTSYTSLVVPSRLKLQKILDDYIYACGGKLENLNLGDMLKEVKVRDHLHRDPIKQLHYLQYLNLPVCTVPEISLIPVRINIHCAMFLSPYCEEVTSLLLVHQFCDT